MSFFFKLLLVFIELIVGLKIFMELCRGPKVDGIIVDFSQGDCNG